MTGLVSSYFIIRILLGTENLLVHSEYYDYFSHCAFSDSVHFGLKDLKAIFSVCFDNGASRPRFYSWLFWMFDTKFRASLFDFIPFYPTVSLTWIFIFTLLPFYFFKLMRNLNCNKNVSLASTFLLLCSQGVLSSLTMYFHSGKPMTLVFLVINLYMASVMQNRCFRGEKEREYSILNGFFFFLALYFGTRLFIFSF